MALGAAEVIQELGLKVPDDIAIIGFDDWEEAECHLPSISSVRQPLQKQVHEALKMLTSMIQGKSNGEDIILPTRLIKRSSCGCPTQTRSIRNEIKDAQKKEVTDAATIQEQLHIVQQVIEDSFNREEKQDSRISPLLKRFFKVLSRFVRSQLSKKEIIKAFSEIIYESDWKYNKIHLWQEILFCVHQNIGKMLENPREISTFNDLFFEYNHATASYIRYKKLLYLFV